MSPNRINKKELSNFEFKRIIIIKTFLPEKEFPLVVGESDALRRDFKVDNSRDGQRFGVQQVGHGALDGLGSGQRFRVHSKEIKQTAGSSLGQ